MFASLNSLFLNRQSGRGQAAARPRSLRPAFERLEDRATPTVTTSGAAADFHVNITEGESVVVGRTDNGKLSVTYDGQDANVQQAASSIEQLTITATNNRANPIDLSGINPAQFILLRQLLVKIDAGDTVNRGPGWSPAGSEMIGGQRFLVFTQGNATLKVTDLTPPTPPATLPAITARALKRGKVLFFDAATGAPRGTLKPFKAFKGRVQLVARDVNGDGVLDVLVRAKVNGKLRKKAYSGRDLSPLPSGLA